MLMLQSQVNLYEGANVYKSFNYMWEHYKNETIADYRIIALLFTFELPKYLRDAIAYITMLLPQTITHLLKCWN